MGELRHTRIVIGLYLLVALTIYGCAASDSGQRLDFTVVEQSEQGLTLDIAVPELHISPVLLAGETFYNLSLNGASHTTVVGAPKLPTLTRMIVVPQGMRAVVVVDDVEMETIPDIIPAPYVEPGDRDDENPPQPLIDKTYYNGNARFPTTFAELGETATLHGLRLATLTLAPVQYDAATTSLEVVRSASVRVVYEDDPDTVVAAVPLTKVFAEIASSVSVFGEAPETVDPPLIGAYLIITTREFEDAADRLAAWKWRKGLPVEMVFTEEIGSSAEEIRSYIEKRYRKVNPPLDYVVLLGDIKQIGTFRGIDNGPADHLFATVDGDDYLPDVIVARIPVNTATEANRVIDKLLRYERSPNEEPEWYGSAVAVSGSDHQDDSLAKRTGSILEEYGGFERIKYLLKSEDTNHSDIMRTYLNQGRSYVAYFGHGWSQGWRSLTPEFDNSDVADLENHRRLPFVNSIACTNGAFHLKEDSFAEVWLKSESRDGAIAVFTSGGSTPFFYSDAIGMAITEGFFEHKLVRFGMAAVFAKMRTASIYPEPLGSKTDKVLQQFHLFGDPEMELRSMQPLQAELYHYVMEEEKLLLLRVSAEDAPAIGAMVHVFNENRFGYTGFTDEHGELVVSMKGIGGVMNIVVTNADLTPLEQTFYLQNDEDVAARVDEPEEEGGCGV